MPVVRELVPVKRPWAQHCLRPQHSPGLRCALQVSPEAGGEPHVNNKTSLPRATFSLFCLPSRISQHPLVPTPIVGLLLLLLLSILLLSQSPTPTWPHLQLYYLQPPPV